MFISRISLNTARYDAQQLISSPYRMHSAVEHSFPPALVKNKTEKGSGRILWRLDVMDGGKEVWLYLVSPEKPDFTHIVEQAGWPLYHEWESKDYDILLDKLAKGQQWKFRLRANTVHKVPETDRLGNPDALAKTLQGHVSVRHQVQWLLNRAEKNGFRILTNNDVPEVIVSQRQKQRFLHHSSTVTLNTAQFDGALEINDPETFRHTLCFGLGRAKGFGCGLMTIGSVMSADGKGHE